MKRVLLLITPVLAVLISLLPLSAAHADFNPSLLIADDTFSNTSSMTASQIDNFLNTFPSSCISTNNGFSAPDPNGYNPSQGFLYGSPVSAGQVIFDAAQAYGLNPQVLLTTLQKEESMVVGDAGCSPLRYSASLGYGCPDGGTTYNYSNLNPVMYYINGNPVNSINGTCVNSAAKVGFAQQIIHATWLLKFGEERSLGNTGWSVVKGNWDNSDDPPTCYSGPMTEGYHKRCSSYTNLTYYDGYTTIDGQSVQMGSGATAALYWYTPHFNGNQSFVNLFTNWFGATFSPDMYTDSDSDTVMDRYDLCKTIAGGPQYLGCTDNSLMGTSAYAGDFNGDGFGDVLVFSVYPDGHAYNVWIYYGSVSGLKDPVFEQNLGPSNGGWDVTKTKAATVDVDKDGRTDLVIFHKGPHNEIVRSVFNGMASESTSAGLSLNSNWTVWGVSYDWTSLRIAGAGDFNGDGYGDVVAFSQHSDGHTFDVLMYPGSSSGLASPTVEQTLGSSNGGWDFEKSKPVAADVNRDGYTDLVIFHQGPSNEVVRNVLKGFSSGLTAPDPNMTAWQFPSQGWLWSNIKIAGVGDFNGDSGGHIDDIAVFSAFPDGHTYNVWIYYGSNNGPQNPSFQFTLGSGNGGWDFAKSKPVGANVDGNGSGYGDLVVFHQGPHDEVVRHILKGSGGGLQQSDPNMVGWQFPSQGWMWSNLRIAKSSN